MNFIALADALDINVSANLGVSETLLPKFIEGYKTDPYFIKGKKSRDITVNKERLYMKGQNKESLRIMVPEVEELRTSIMRKLHDSPAAGHPGRDRMYHLISRYFFWRGMKRDISEYCLCCDGCQKNKAKQFAEAGLTEPLQIADYPFQSISMDFITKLPVTPDGNDTLVVWVDRLTKMVIVHACKEAHTAKDFARYTIDHVISKHGCPESFVSDRDVRFTSEFWKTTTEILGAERWMSTAFRPQTDGQTERMNRCVEEVLRNYVSWNQANWDQHIQMCAFSINNSYQTSTRTSPFMLNHGRHPRLPSALTKLTDQLEKRFVMVPWRKAQAALRFTQKMQEDIRQAKEYIKIAQARMKAYRHRKEGKNISAGRQGAIEHKKLKIEE